MLLLALSATFLARGQIIPAAIGAASSALLWFFGQKSSRSDVHRTNDRDLGEAEELLGLQPGYGPTEIDIAFRQSAKTAHPDHGGSDVHMERLAAARDLLKRHLADTVAGPGAEDR